MNSTDLPASDSRQRPPAPMTLWLGLAIAVLLDAPVQLLWKSLMELYAARNGPGGMSMATQGWWFARQTRLWGLILLFGCQFLNWMWVLAQADLSFAQPFTALSYLTVSAGAAIVLHEHLSPGRMAGIGLILSGVILIGSTPHQTTSPRAAP